MKVSEVTLTVAETDARRRILETVRRRGILLELRYNYNHDEKGRFASGSNRSLTGKTKDGKIQPSGKIVTGRNGKTIKAEDFPTIAGLDGECYAAQPGSTITKIHTFAGYGTKNKLRIEPNLLKTGGQSGKWQHTTGDVKICVDGKQRTAEVHWFQEETVGIIRARVKRWRNEG